MPDTKAPLRSPLEASPELRRTKLEKARFVRRIFGTIFGILLIGSVAWGGWAAWSIRTMSVRTQTPFRADKAAAKRLDGTKGEYTLLVVRASAETSAVTFAALRQPEHSSGTWAIAFPVAAAVSSENSTATLEGAFRQGRASLLKEVERLVGSKVGHYIEIQGSQLQSAAANWASSAATSEALGALSAAGGSQSPSSTVAALGSAAKAYRATTTGRLGSLRLPGLAHSLAGAVVSDMGATQLDGFFRRLGSDCALTRMRVAVVPTEGGTTGPIVISASAAHTLAAQMAAGMTFNVVSAKTARVSPGSITVTVLNGAGREGVAGQAARILRRDGYRIAEKDVANANQFVYDQTLVIYKKDQAAAGLVAKGLPVGRVVPSRGMYTFSTDVLVVVGRDWP